MKENDYNALIPDLYAKHVADYLRQPSPFGRLIPDVKLSRWERLCRFISPSRRYFVFKYWFKDVVERW